ncbi:MAG: hypothetical protein V7633_4706 [Pseudonocardia sp.]|jgi:enoyl-CoA hydratase/carnithine racemase
MSGPVLAGGLELPAADAPPEDAGGLEPGGATLPVGDRRQGGIRHRQKCASEQAGRRCLSDEALRIGLVTDVVEPAEPLEAAYAKAAEIMLNPPFSVEPAKQGMWASADHPSGSSAGNNAGPHRRMCAECGDPVDPVA